MFIVIDGDLLIYLIAAIVSLIIFVINQIMQLLCILMTELEHQPTRTFYNISAIKKIVLGQFIVTTVLIFMLGILVTTDSKYGKIFGKGGLIYNANLIFLGNSFLPFLSQLIDISGLIRFYLRNRVIKQHEKG